MRNLSLTLSFLLFLTLAGVSSAYSQEAAAYWTAGVAKTNITPNEPMWMAGYAARDRPSEGKLHDLWAKALVLEDAEGNKVVLITTDLVGIRQGLSNRVRDRLKEKYDLNRSHTGPETESSRHQFSLDPSQLDKIDNYAKNLENQIVELVRKALNARKPARLYSANGVTRFQVNRRTNKEADINTLSELNGPNDFAVPVIKVLDEKGEVMAVAFGYACHPTVLADYNWSGDYVGFATMELEKNYPGATALFFQGAGADQNPLPRRSVPLAEQYGSELAAAVRRTLKEEMRPLSSALTSAYSEINLTFAKPSPSKDELELITQSSEYPDYLKHSAKVLMAKLEKGESLITSYPYPVQVWKLGDQPIFSLGGEVLVGYSIALKQIFGPDIFVMGYSNDVMAYIPTASGLAAGGYEGTRSPIFTSPWAPNIETRILGEALLLAEKVGIPTIEKSITEN